MRVDGAPGLGPRRARAQPVPKAGEGGQERHGQPADEGEGGGTVEVPGPTLILAHERDHIEHRRQDVRGYGDVRQRGVKGFASPAPEPLELATAEGQGRTEGEVAHGCKTSIRTR